MTGDQRLRELGRLCGIAPEYTDIWGERHPVSRESLLGLLTAMGAIRDEADVPRALAERDEAPWRRVLPPVAVVRAGAWPYRVEVALPQSALEATLRWRVEPEAGEPRQGERPARELPQLAQRDLGGGGVVRCALELPDPLPPGYHRLELEAPGLPPVACSLIVAPDTCFLPRALEDAGRVWGPALQLYALRSARNWGVGDFTDLKGVVEFAGRAGAGIVGLSPLHALFPHNPRHLSPYSPSSRLFLNPLYLDLEAIPEFAACAEAQAALADPQFQARLRALRAAELVDYPGVAELKLTVLELLYRCFLETGPGERRDAFARYLAEEGEALWQFALYNALQEHFHREDPAVWGWPAWPPDWRDPASPTVAAFQAERRERVEFHAWVQWQCETQLAAAGQRCWQLGLGVGLYQDLAVSVDRAGAEAWAGQTLFALGASVGAPPDDFNLHGQDWGLPPLIPERLREAAYAPFIELVRRNMRHCGALRIDHVMGLMRLFWVPPGGTPEDGAYVHYPFQDLLGILALESQRNQCLVIGEDLGTVTDEVRAALAALGVLSYRLLLFERDPDGGFKPPAAYPPRALVAASTHDLPTLKGCWAGHDLDLRARLGLYPTETQRETQVVSRAQDRARLLMALDREGLLPPGVTVHPVSAPEMTPELALAIQVYLTRSPCAVMMVQPEDLLGQLDQANLPGTTEQHPNWQRKLPLNLEEWSSDARVQALAEALLRERGSAAHPKAEEAPPPAARPAIPRATYRLQFNRAFTFRDAAALVPYLHQLGISHCYASPYLKARPGSSHGYDIIDHNALNPEIGSEEDFEALVAALKQRGMGQMLDLVPNHMGVMGADNHWWLDVLENGPASAYAGYFDIDWDPVNEELRGQVLVPVLGDHYGAVLERGELQLRFDPERGEFSVFHHEHRFPLDPREYPRVLGLDAARLDARLGPEHSLIPEFHSLLTALSHLPPRDETDPERLAERRRDKEIHKRHLAEMVARCPDLGWFIDENLAAVNGTPGDPASFDALHALLAVQAYRLAFWRVASDEINFRRFFDINDLAALRMENPEVFEATHRLVFRLLEEGKVDALRIDHPDGLYDPLQYFRRLQHRRAALPPPEEPPLVTTYVVAEKILAGFERLPPAWPLHGTTGYDFASLVNGVFVDPAAATRMERLYRAFTRESLPFEELLYQSKRLIMSTALAGESNVLANALARIARAERRTCDFTLNGLRNALREVVACFPVYRTCVDERGVSEEDRGYINRAVDAAKARSTAGDVSIFEFLRQVLLGEIAEGKSEAYRARVLAFTMKLQQFTAPVTAKGMEDTGFYVYNRLASLNEVGGEPRRFGVPVMAFHHANRERRKNWPHTLLASSTHDNKRSEDVRARLNVLSEIPEEWRARLARWEKLNRGKRRSAGGVRLPGRNDEYLLYQTLLGVWPLEPVDPGALEALRGRIEAYMLKAVREAKVHTSWINPNTEYEEAVTGFAGALLASTRGNAFLDEFLHFQRKVAKLGMYNSLSQLLLKLTVPGVPDIYQGNELWDFSLVDPDNRRPVDYDQRRRLLAELRTAAGSREAAAGDLAASLLESMEDGRIKLYLTWKALALRRSRPALFRDGDYLPLRVTGAGTEHVIAFARHLEDAAAAVIAPRWFARLKADQAHPLGDAVWGDTAMEAPAPRAWTNVLTGETVLTAGEPPRLALAQVLGRFPWALLVPKDG